MCGRVSMFLLWYMYAYCIDYYCVLCTVVEGTRGGVVVDVDGGGGGGGG